MSKTTLTRMFGTPARVALSLGILAGLLGTATAGAESPCDALHGAVDSNQICQAHHADTGYTVDLSFPVDYPDQPPLGDYVISLRDDFVEFAQSPPEHARPYSLRVTPVTYRSGDAATGTASVVLKMNESANPRLPMAWYKTFNYDLGARAPITLDTLFKPGVNTLDVVFPAVRRELEKRWQPEVLESMLGSFDDAAFRNFALTDDAVIFFIGQGHLLGHPEGPLEVSVPRTALAPSLA